jgi:hypothetical protein
VLFQKENPAWGGKGEGCRIAWSILFMTALSHSEKGLFGIAALHEEHTTCPIIVWLGYLAGVSGRGIGFGFVGSCHSREQTGLQMSNVTSRHWYASQAGLS